MMSVEEGLGKRFHGVPSNFELDLKYVMWD